MDYVFTITEFDADNVDSSFTVNHGRTEHQLDLTNKTYVIYRKADGLSETTPMVWEDNIPLITSFITREKDRVSIQLLLDKTRQYEVSHFGNYMRISTDETIETCQAKIDETNNILTYLKNYTP